MRKRAAAWACRPGELSGQPRDTSPRPDRGLPPRDPIGVAALWDTAGQLADEPRPPESFPYGSPDLRRLRAGRYRVFYAVDEERRVVQIDHVGRLP
jgi:mRNA interferase RelE/StbE